MKRGFTLIEILSVVLIIGILSAVAVPQYRRSLERSRVTEAYEMLPAIYDAQQRLYVESETAPNLPTFNLLDINMRGKVSPTAGNQWLTNNFTYTMGPRLHMMNYFQTNTAPVWATARKGKYTGAQIFYDGENFSCCDNSATGACAAFAIAKNPTACLRLANLTNIDVGSAAAWAQVEAPVIGPAVPKQIY